MSSSAPTPQTASMVRAARILSAIAAGLLAAGPGVTHQPRGRTDRAVRLLVPANRIAVGFGQTRTAKQLPVLTMECGYSRWLSGLLVPTRSAADFFTGWWQQIDALGAVPPTPSAACATRRRRRLPGRTTMRWPWLRTSSASDGRRSGHADLGEHRAAVLVLADRDEDNGRVVL
jgi:hypothetical protein